MTTTLQFSNEELFFHLAHHLRRRGEPFAREGLGDLLQTPGVSPLLARRIEDTLAGEYPHEPKKKAS